MVRATVGGLMKKNSFTIEDLFSHRINNPYKGPKNVNIPILFIVLEAMCGKNLLIEVPSSSLVILFL